MQFTLFCREFDLVSKYAFSQAPSCTNFLPPGSASDSRTGSDCIINRLAVVDFSHRQIAWTQLLISASILCLALGVKIAWAKMRLQKLRHSLLLASVRSCNWNNRKCSRWGTPTAARGNDGIWGTCVCSMGLPRQCRPPCPHPTKDQGQVTKYSGFGTETA